MEFLNWVIFTDIALEHRNMSQTWRQYSEMLFVVVQWCSIQTDERLRNNVNKGKGLEQQSITS